MRTPFAALFACTLFVGLALSACADDGSEDSGDAGDLGSETDAGDGDGDGEGDGDGDGEGDGDGDGEGDGDGDGEGDGDGDGDGDGACPNGPLALPLPGCTPTPVPDTGDFHQDCVDRINQFRWECQCLPPLQRWTEAEACSNQQSADDQNGGGAHGNFGACGESAQNTCPNYPAGSILPTCLQQMWDEGPGEPFSEHGHYINMSNLNYKKVACGTSQGATGVWSNQNFSG